MADNFFDEEDVVELDSQEDNFFDEEDTVQIGRYTLPKSDLEEGGAVEAMAKSAANPFGVLPIAKGGLEVVGKLAGYKGLGDPEIESQKIEESDKEGLIEAYYRAKEAEKRDIKKLETEHPVASFIPQFGTEAALTGGASMFAKALSKGGKVAKGVSKLLPNLDNLKLDDTAKLSARLGQTGIEGAKVGGLYGLTTGDSRLLEGDIAGTAKDVSKGVASGFLGGTAAEAGLQQVKKIPKAVQSVKKALPNLPGIGPFLRSYKFSEKTGKYISNDNINEVVEDMSEELLDKINEVLNKKGVDKKTQMEVAEQIGVRVDAGEPLEQAIEKVLSIPKISETIRKNNETTLDVLNEINEGFSRVQAKYYKTLEKQRARMAARKPKGEFGDIEDVIDPLSGRQGAQFTEEVTDKYGDVKEKVRGAAFGERPLDTFDIRDMSLEETEVLTNILREEMASADESSKKVYRKLLAQIYEAKKLAEEGAESAVGEVNRDISRLLRARTKLGMDIDKFGSSPEYVRDDLVDILRKRTRDISPKSQIDTDRAFRYLEKVDPSFSEQKSKLEDLQNLLESFGGDPKELPLTPQSIGGRLIAPIGSLAGKSSRATKDVVKETYKLGQDVYKFITPDKAQKLVSSLAELGTAGGTLLAKKVTEIAKKPEAQRVAAINGLMQQPGYRKTMNDAIALLIGEQEE